MQSRAIWIHLIILALPVVISVFPSAISFQWEDEDSVIVEALTADSILKRRGGKFPFTWPWQSQGFVGRARADTIDPDFTCYTTVGEQGVCATLRECYPMLYSVEYVKERHDAETSNLIDTLKSISGPCDMPNFSKFRIAFFSDMPDSLICCPSRIVFQEQGVPSSTTVKPETPTSVLTVEFQSSQKPSSESRQAVSGSGRSPSIPDAVAAHYHHEYTCGYINQTLPDGMKVEEAANRFPWIVALVGSRGHFCAGSLIDRYNVLTSASCTSYMTSEDVSTLQIYLGDYKLHSVVDGPVIVRKVSRVIYHRGFDNQTLKNDIALLRFKLPAPVGTPRVLPICLPKKTFKRSKAALEQNMLVGVEATLAGWGRSWNPSRTPILQKTKMIIWSNEDCRIKYGYLARSGITDHMLCAYPPRGMDTPGIQVDMDTETMDTKGGKDKNNEKVQNTNKENERYTSEHLHRNPIPIQDCIGDTGGPLVIQNKDHTFEQVGIVSWNIGCSHYPYIHTRVGSYLNWIEKNRHR